MHRILNLFYGKGVKDVIPLRARLVMLLVLILVPVYSFIAYSVFEIRQQAKQYALHNASLLVQAAALEQTNLIEFTRQQLFNFAQLPVVRRPAWARLCNRTLAAIRQKNSNYTNMGVINLDGTVRCSALAVQPGLNLADRPYFREALQSRGFVVGGYQIGRISGQPGINLATPVLNAAGEPEGVVFIALNPNLLTQVLFRTVTLPAGTTLFMVNQQGMVLAYEPNPKAWVGKLVPDNPLIRAILANPEKGSLQARGLDGVRRLYVFRRIFSNGPEQVDVSLGLPLRSIYGPADTLLLHAIILMLLLTVLMIALVWINARRLLLGPVEALIEAARRLGKGDLGARTCLPHTPDEFGQLAQSMDDMAEALQRRAEEVERSVQILEEKDRFLTLVGKMAKVGGWEFDPGTLEARWTEEVARIHEMDPRDPISVESGINFYVGDSRARIEAAVKAAIEEAKPYDLELEIVTARGHHRWVRTIGEPSVRNGQVVKVSGSFQDITERRLIEEDIRQLNASLEVKVEERTQELYVANKELEAFSYSVSHDLRAPLRSIDGFSQALLEDYGSLMNEEAMGYLKRVRAATQHMGQLIDDLLVLSRITRADMQREVVDLSALAQEVLDELQRTEPLRCIRLKVEPGLSAQGDAKLIRIALVNLLGNAWKFSSRVPEARIEFGARTGADGRVDFFVRDNGSGFDMAYVDKLFGAFQRLHLASEFPGTGIGLATVARIIHRHGGQVWAEGQVNQGAVFYFTLPGPEGAGWPGHMKGEGT
ncbi:MAG: HAMP domain-containing protein [Proteobacteria bacterium]|nr:HAMP domain-containing protein [Pseudomonadota bacterium]